MGKSYLAIGLAIATAQSGRRVYYGTLADLITSLEDAHQAGHLARRLKALVFPSLLVVDEIGYLPITRAGAMFFFQLRAGATKSRARCSRATKASTSVTSWGRCDGWRAHRRLVHHCHIVNTRGNSHRMCQHAELSTALRRAGDHRTFSPLKRRVAAVLEAATH